MSSLASEVNVANLALTDLGADRIISLTEDSENARKVNAIFALVRDAELRSHPWNFAIERRNFNQTVNTPEFGFDSEFQIPGDVLRILSSENRNYDEWVREGDKILVNDTSFKARCIIRIEDPTIWDEQFVVCFGARLAAELAYSITDSRTVAVDKWELYKLKKTRATGVDAQEGTPLELLTDEWLDSRLGGVVTPRAE
jgi:hypothetical protein